MNERFINDFEVVKTFYLKDRFPFVTDDKNESGLLKAKNSSPSLDLVLVNLNKYEITYEHCGYDVPESHKRYCDENENVTINIIKLNHEWVIPLTYTYCFKKDKSEYIHTYSDCSMLSEDYYNVCINDNTCEWINNDAIVFCCQWSDGFQHSIQDLFPRICAVQRWLSENSNVDIIIPFNLDLLWFIKKYLKIKNKIIITEKFWVGINNLKNGFNLYTDVFNPLHKCEMTPFPLYRNMSIIAKEQTEDKYIVVFDRSGCDARVIDNEKLINIIQKYLLMNNINNLEIKLINPSKITREELILILKNTRGVIAPHGGANYNVLMMRRTNFVYDKKRFFIELVCNRHLHHTYHIALGSYIRYKGVLCKGGHYEKYMDFDEEDIMSALKCFL